MLVTAAEALGLREVAAAAARVGGAAVRAAAPGRRHATKSSPTDPVTAADRAAEAAIVRFLRDRRPDDGVLGEEGGVVARGAGRRRWVVDALDGSVNYLYGLPQCAVSIACERLHDGRADGQPGWEAVAAAVLDVGRRELFTAAAGAGALVDGVPIRVNDPVLPELALVAAELSYHSASRRRQGQLLERLLPQVRDLRSFGSSALDLCWTACGRVDAFLEDELEVWDHAAGALIVREAGGRVTPWGTGVVASGPALHQPLLRLIGWRPQRAGPGRSLGEVHA